MTNTTKKHGKGFAPLAVIIVAATAISLAFAAYMSVKVKSQRSENNNLISNSGLLPNSITPSAITATPITATITNKPKLSPTQIPAIVTNSVTPTSKAKYIPLTTPTSTPTPPDITAPTTNIFYPVNNGSITYKIDGKVCAIALAPTDKDSKLSDIETEFKFDNSEWSGYKSGLGYFCSDVLANGQHAISYHSKDKAGNVEEVKTLNFTVVIAGN